MEDTPVHSSLGHVEFRIASRPGNSHPRFLLGSDPVGSTGLNFAFGSENCVLPHFCIKDMVFLNVLL